MDGSKLWGWAKLRKGPWKLALDFVGHLAIGGAVAGAVAYWRRGKKQKLVLCVTAAASVLGVREMIQFATSGSPHILDRVKDILEGTLGGLLAWAVSLLF